VPHRTENGFLNGEGRFIGAAISGLRCRVLMNTKDSHNGSYQKVPHFRVVQRGIFD